MTNQLPAGNSPVTAEPGSVSGRLVGLRNAQVGHRCGGRVWAPHRAGIGPFAYYPCMGGDERTASPAGTSETRDASRGGRGSLGFRLGGFRLDVDGSTPHETDDTWDANWMSVTARCQASGATVVARCAVLTSWSIERFCSGLVGVARAGSGSAHLAAEEPCLSLCVTPGKSGSAASLRVDVTPDHAGQGHWFVFAVGAAELEGAIDQCRSILAAFPAQAVVAHD